MYRHILVILDSSGLSERSLTRVLLLARKVDSTLHLLIVYPARYADRLTTCPAGCAEPPMTQAARYLCRIATRLRQEGLLVSMEVRVGQPVETILAAAQEIDADLIAMTIPWRSGDGWPEDRQITEEVIKQAPIPVLVERTCHQVVRVR